MKYLLSCLLMSVGTITLAQNETPTLNFVAEIQENGEIRFVPKTNSEVEIANFPEFTTQCWTTGENCMEMTPWKVHDNSGMEAFISVPTGTPPADWLSDIKVSKVELSGNYAARLVEEESRSSKARKIMSDLMNAAAGEMCDSKFAPREMKVTVEAGFEIFLASKVVVEGTFVKEDICS